jgi:AcrR family transcriptional regulator
MEQPGLRERKKAETSRRIWLAAMQLFVERGYDAVSTAEIASAADVSKMTLFNYFRTKEDLVMLPMEDHVEELATVVRGRADGETPVAALRRHFLAGLAEGEPMTGLSDRQFFLDAQRLVIGTPALLLRALHLHRRRAEALAKALAEPGEPGPFELVRAAQIVGVLSALIEHNTGRMLAGEKADEVHPEAVALAERAFALLS